jgi:1-acyl-sn-glycerol-3-phosphate acyltransferase
VIEVDEPKRPPVPAPARTPQPPAVLGSDPFVDPGGHDPLEGWLDALDARAGVPPAVAAESGGAAATPLPRAAEPQARPRRVARARRRTPAPELRTPPALPRLADVEVRPELRALARLVGEDPARRLSALAVTEGWDRFGLSASALRQAFPFFYALYRLWFRVRSQGHAHVPSAGPVVLAANHGGLLPFDGAMAVVDLLLHTDPPRLPRAIVDRWAGGLPWVNVFFARVGQVIGTHENFARLLADEQAVLVFPEGTEAIRKPITQRYRLQRFHTGFVAHALRARAPIVPMAILGSDDQAPILYDVKPLARLLHLPAAPITPTFPWLGPLGLVPYPVSYRIAYGAPLCFHERFGAEAAEDPAVVGALAGQVRRAVQGLLDRHRT